jgi:Kef-type K+ transport system membrane component KefB/mannitol/fructose-specific phosphotransferase system IIA component (Ntr-type)
MVESLSNHEITTMFLSIGILLGFARILGEIATRVNQPSILGEILAGIILGPTVLGSISPSLLDTIFPSQGGAAFIFNGITILGVTMFMLVAGLEVDFPTICRHGRAAVPVSLLGIIFPFAFGFSVTWLYPTLITGTDNPHADRLIQPLFFANALAISALPVIAKTMIDLGIYRSNIGMIVISSAIINDLAGWIIFAIILSMMGLASLAGMGVGYTILFTLVFALSMLTIVRWIIDKILEIIQTYLSWPGATLSFILSLSLLCAALTEWIGIHAVFGSFLLGVAIGDSGNLKDQIRQYLNRFISFFFAPIFFASIGLRLNFLANFNLKLVLLVIIIATIGKVIGCSLGAKLGKIENREAWAIGFGMNARGSMEVILGLLALQYGVIKEDLFVALVSMALVTSLMSGPIMQKILNSKKPVMFIRFLYSGSFMLNLKATNLQSAIYELIHPLSVNGLITPAAMEHIDWKLQGDIIHAGREKGIAILYGCVDAIHAPVVLAGVSKMGIGINTNGGKAATLIFLVLSSKNHESLRQEIQSDIRRIFNNRNIQDKAFQASNYPEFLAVLKTENVICMD